MANNEEKTVKEVLDLVYDALKEKGYNPIDQITGYLASEDPAYITPNRGARRMIIRFDRDEYLAELLKSYFDR